MFFGLPDVIQTANDALEILCLSNDDFETERCYIMSYAENNNVAALKSWALHYIKILEYLSYDTGVAAVVAEKLDDKLDCFIKEGRKKLKELEFKFDVNNPSEVQPNNDLPL